MNTNLELIKEWIEALRSGEYTQGKKALRNIKNEFCCLGVLCDITKEKLNLEWELEVYELADELIEGEIYHIGKEKCEGLLPFKVSEYLGAKLNYKVMISARNSKILEYVNNDLRLNYTYLTDLNDVWELDFNQIADILEEEFLK